MRAFSSTSAARAENAPNREPLIRALTHARRACELDQTLGEAWATLGFVLTAAGQVEEARAAARRAAALEPTSWRHHFRLGIASWGEERLRAVDRTLSLLPGFPLAHWLAASVYVARQALTEAERELSAGIAVLDDQGISTSRFSAVALHWVLGLVHLARDDDKRALGSSSVSCRSRGPVTSIRASAAPTRGSTHRCVRLRQGRAADARAAFDPAVERVASHPMARLRLPTFAKCRVASRPDFDEGGLSECAIGPRPHAQGWSKAGCAAGG